VEGVVVVGVGNTGSTAEEGAQQQKPRKKPEQYTVIRRATRLHNPMTSASPVPGTGAQRKVQKAGVVKVAG